MKPFKPIRKGVKSKTYYVKFRLNGKQIFKSTGMTIKSDAEEWIKENTKDYEKVDVIGSGGNINKIFKISGKATGKPLTYFYLSAYFKELSFAILFKPGGLAHPLPGLLSPGTRVGDAGKA